MLRCAADILPIVHGGTGRQKALALLGDKLLDVKLYEKLLSKGMCDVGLMTQQRSALVSNLHLSKSCIQLIPAHIISHDVIRSLSHKERGTLLEAYLGAIYEQEGFCITPSVTQVIDSILSELKRNMAADSKKCAQWKTSKSLLNEFLQRYGISNLYIQSSSYGEHEQQPPFKATFCCPPQLLRQAGLIDPGIVVSEECASKREAEEQVAQLALQLLTSQLNGIENNRQQ